MANLITNPVVPQIPLLRKQDYPDALGTQDGLDKYFTLVNPFFQAIGNALNGSLSIGNLNGEVISFQVTTPISDWVTLTLASGWTSTVAQSNGFAPPRYRINDDGQIQFSGGCEYQTATPAYPFNVVAAGGIPATQYNEDMTSWIQRFDNSGPPGNQYVGMGLIRADNTGALTLRSYVTNLGTGTGTQNSIQFLSLCGLFYTPATVVPRTLNCFPKQIRLVGAGQPVDVWLTSCQDVNNQTLSPGTAVLGLAPGCVSWQRVNTIQQTGTNMIQINNIAGLVLGRTYNVRCWVIYSAGSGAANAGVGQAQASAAGSNG